MDASAAKANLVLLNGPPRAGKSLASKVLADLIQDEVRVLYLSEQIKRATHCAYGMFDVPFDFFEDCKDAESELFFGLTPRQAYIAHSEEYMKKVHGADVFVHMFLKRLTDRIPPISVVPDVGFQAEIDCMRRVWRGGNIVLLRMHRAGTSFAGDSRRFVVGGPGVKEIDIYNETLDQLRADLGEVARGLLAPQATPGLVPQDVEQTFI